MIGEKPEGAPNGRAVSEAPGSEVRAGEAPARVLCVDDEPGVLEGLRLHLERRYRLSTATSGAEALALLDRDEPYAVVISDMRMPEMDGAAFLARVRQRFPDTVRLLLTAHADVNSAVAAVNQGQIFRFLTKPCPPATLLSAIESAIEQYRLVTAERVLLEKTLHGSIKALTDVLALTQPLAFGRAMRIRQSVAELANRVGMKERWQVELAAMLSQIGCVTLPAETVENIYYGRDLSPKERKQLSELPHVAERLLGNIPRLEAVREILLGAVEGAHATSPLVRQGAHMLRIALDCDMLESQGFSLPVALYTMRTCGIHYDSALLEAFAEARRSINRRHQIRELPLVSLKVGMVLLNDLYAEDGKLVAVRGYEITPGFVERAQNWEPGTVREPVPVLIRQVL
jgi:CheY-like chemotaxis protein